MQDVVLNKVARWGLTSMVIFVLFILSAIPLDFFNMGEIRPAFMLIAIYYMTILRPSVMPAFVVFLIGLALDLASSYPFGLNAMILVSVQWMVRSQRKLLLSHSFKIIWGGFAIVALIAGIAQWAVLSLFNFSLYSAKPIMFSVLLSSFVFPLLAFPLLLVHKSLIDE